MPNSRSTKSARGRPIPQSGKQRRHRGPTAAIKNKTSSGATSICEATSRSPGSRSVGIHPRCPDSPPPAPLTHLPGQAHWSGKEPTAWEIEEVPPGDQLPEGLRKAVLGGRSRIVFHEGVTGRLDQQIYEALLPGWNVVAAGNCNDVLKSVAGLFAQESLHWITARGIVDKDFRRDSPPRGVTHLKVHEAENIFYLSQVLEHMAGVQAKNLGESFDGTLRNAYEKMRPALKVEGVRNKIVEQRCLQALRDDLTSQLEVIKTWPTEGSLELRGSVSVGEVFDKYDQALAEHHANLDMFLRDFPVRESGLRDAVAKSLFYPSKDIYERAVIQQVRQCSMLREAVLDTTGVSGILTS